MEDQQKGETIKTAKFRNTDRFDTFSDMQYAKSATLREKPEFQLNEDIYQSLSESNFDFKSGFQSSVEFYSRTHDQKAEQEQDKSFSDKHFEFVSDFRPINNISHDPNPQTFMTDSEIMKKKSISDGNITTPELGIRFQWDEFQKSRTTYTMTNNSEIQETNKDPQTQTQNLQLPLINEAENSQLCESNYLIVPIKRLGGDHLSLDYSEVKTGR